ncbi:hypothetical protein Trco_007442 [Trichoderma cornu-damae]|uniref:Uncharacterized protein n=1 Tax=Trichoderma cornu-damae TaxID=654480 RepID=A0A9P8TRJ7_9HYPO|nr:hypothetical protein Trco_007442 [Trichoderma cornu-damae]
MAVLEFEPSCTSVLTIPRPPNAGFISAVLQTPAESVAVGGATAAEGSQSPDKHLSHKGIHQHGPGTEGSYSLSVKLHRHVYRWSYRLGPDPPGSRGGMEPSGPVCLHHQLH